MSDIYVWECEGGHRCAVAEVTMRYSLLEPRCDVVVAKHGRTQDNKYRFPYYEGAPVLCGKQLIRRLDVISIPR